MEILRINMLKKNKLKIHVCIKKRKVTNYKVNTVQNDILRINNIQYI